MFNVRVYGILMNEQKQVLVSDEFIRGNYYTKFPGGGLEFGEGTRDCLKREFKEELDLNVKIGDHLYTTDFFQHSAFDNSQVISIYYLVAGKQIPEAIVNLIEGERTYWVDIKEVSENSFTLPIDKRVGSMLQTLFG